MNKKEIVLNEDGEFKSNGKRYDVIEKDEEEYIDDKGCMNFLSSAVSSCIIDTGRRTPEQKKVNIEFANSKTLKMYCELSHHWGDYKKLRDIIILFNTATEEKIEAWRKEQSNSCYMSYTGKRPPRIRVS